MGISSITNCVPSAFQITCEVILRNDLCASRFVAKTLSDLEVSWPCKNEMREGNMGLVKVRLGHSGWPRTDAYRFQSGNHHNNNGRFLECIHFKVTKFCMVK